MELWAVRGHRKDCHGEESIAGPAALCSTASDLLHVPAEQPLSPWAHAINHWWESLAKWSLFFNLEWSYKDVQVIPQLLHKKKVWYITVFAGCLPLPSKGPVLSCLHAFNTIHVASNSNILAVFLCTALQTHQQSKRSTSFVSIDKENWKKILSLHYYPLLQPCSFSHAPRMQPSEKEVFETERVYFQHVAMIRAVGPLPLRPVLRP